MPVQVEGQSGVIHAFMEVQYKTPFGTLNVRDGAFDPGYESLSSEIVLKDSFSGRVDESEIVVMRVKTYDVKRIHPKTVGEISAPEFSPLVKYLARKIYGIRMSETKMPDGEARLSERSWF